MFTPVSTPNAPASPWRSGARPAVSNRCLIDGEADVHADTEADHGQIPGAGQAHVEAQLIIARREVLVLEGAAARAEPGRDAEVLELDPVSDEAAVTRANPPGQGAS